ncbi:hypothetical protein LR48_Vigan662s000500 [Vigna angularis]|uniref:Uncharacterized protein n=2 Tax=Phaseolus angularis TaxID=3914 RepID=A0A0L9TFN3_PHAAN|nr:hypothetical protein LR48_Vigan662s000500 [Vigna angularis]BAT89739.1 hypothetical protein VIGAN_06077700 [Vigna angularis var. angularis]
MELDASPSPLLPPAVSDVVTTGKLLDVCCWLSAAADLLDREASPPLDWRWLDRVLALDQLLFTLSLACLQLTAPTTLLEYRDMLSAGLVEMAGCMDGAAPLAGFSSPINKWLVPSSFPLQPLPPKPSQECLIFSKAFLPLLSINCAGRVKTCCLCCQLLDALKLSGILLDREGGCTSSFLQLLSK